MAKKLDFALAALKQAITNKPAYVPETIEEAALRIVEKCLQELKKTNKLILAMGEVHDQDEHHWLEAKVLTELSKQDVPVTLAIERSSNSMEQKLVSAPGEVTSMMFQTLDPNNHMRATFIAEALHNGSLRTKGDGFAPVLAALELGLPIVFADAAHISQSQILPPRTLDMRHDATRYMAQQLGLMSNEVVYSYKLAEFNFPWISAVEAEGMKLRNHYMVKSCLETPGHQEQRQHVTLLLTGRKHLHGGDDCDYEDSLAALFTKNGAKMIAVRMRDAGSFIFNPNASTDGDMLLWREALKDNIVGKPDTLYVSLTSLDDNAIDLDKPEAFERLGIPQYNPSTPSDKAADILEKMKKTAEPLFPEFKVRGW